MNTPNYDDTAPLCITYSNRSQPPHDYSLTHWSLGDLDVIFKMQFRYFFWTVYVSSDFPLIKPSHECHWALFMISHHCFRNGLVPSANKPLPPGITWANVGPDLCRHMVLLSRMSYFQTHYPSLLTYLRPKQNGSHICRRHVQIHFLERDILISIKISLTLHPRSDHFQHWFR